MRQVFRGEIYSCEFPKGTGSEQMKDRPVAIIQNDTGNKYSPTTIVGVISTQRFKSGYPMHVDIQKGLVGLNENSTIMLEQIFTIDKSRLQEKLADVRNDKKIMEQLDKAIMVSLGVEV